MATVPVQSTVPQTTDAARRAEASHFSKRRLANILTVVTLLIGAAFILLPLFWIIDTAFKPIGDAFVIPPKFVYKPTLGQLP